jgi:hypothetical protein
MVTGEVGLWSRDHLAQGGLFGSMSRSTCLDSGGAKCGGVVGTGIRVEMFEGGETLSDLTYVEEGKWRRVRWEEGAEENWAQ